MKKLIAISLCTLLLSSCTDFWSDGTVRKFHEACTAESIKWAGSPDKADAYCQCVLDKMMVKYPNEEDAFGHLGDLAHDTDLMDCKDWIKDK